MRGRKPTLRKPTIMRAGVPKCPTILDKVGRAEWRRVTAEMTELLTLCDMAELAAYCSCWSRFVKLEKQVQAEGEIVKTRQGRQRNPTLLALNKCLMDLRAFAGDFGFNPVARSRVVKPDKTPAKTAFEEFVTRAG